MLVSALLGKWGLPISPATFRLGFFAGLVGCGVCILYVVVESRRAHKTSGSFEILFQPWAGFLVVLLPIETGLAGFLGFSSFWRYPPLLISILGVIGLAGLLLLGYRIRSWRKERGSTSQDQPNGQHGRPQ
jgi:hypothetical protein